MRTTIARIWCGTPVSPDPVVIAGRPIGASSARIIALLLSALRARGGARCVASLCIGRDETTAMAFELV